MVALALIVDMAAFVAGVAIIILLISEGGGRTTNLVFDLIFLGIGGNVAVLLFALKRLDKELGRQRAVEECSAAAYVASLENAARFHRITSQI